MTRSSLIGTFWSKMPCDGIEGYSNMIEQLLGYLSNEQIEEIIRSMGEPDDELDDE